MAVYIKFSILFLSLFQAPKPANRTINIFTDNPNNAYCMQQVNILRSDPNGIKNRLITFKIIPWNATNAGYYKKCGVSNSPFTVILIGLDNGEKLRSHEPITLAKLYDLIDNMPMRKLQIQYKH